MNDLEQSHVAVADPQQPCPPDDLALDTARKVYSSYCATHAEPLQPVGIAVNQYTQHGYLLFKGKPVLLPHESFVPFSLITSEA